MEIMGGYEIIKMYYRLKKLLTDKNNYIYYSEDNLHEVVRKNYE